MRVYLFLSLFCLLSGSFCLAQDGFSYWWQSDGLIDYKQMEELDALDGDRELWCALAELYVGRDAAEEAECIFEKPKETKEPKGKKGKMTLKANLSGGANLDTNGNLKNKFAKFGGRAGGFSADVNVKENKGIKGTAAFRHGIFYAKGGDLTSKSRGVLSEFNVGDLHLGGEWLFRDGRDSSWIYGKFGKNFWEKRIYAGGNFRIIEPYAHGTRLWSRTWQGVRLGDWNFRATEIAVAKENENTLDFTFLLERKRKGARLAFNRDKNKSSISAGVKPLLQGTDSLWARAEHPLRLRSGWDKRIQNVRVSNSFSFRENKPLEFRSESKIKIPLPFSPLLTIRWTMNRMDLKQFYVGLGM
ncbi:MAG: hypothetical protein LBQ87_03065 [Candidatus Fibromonas sp.]|jgi:hypothetical protein|nr:hypothetical protein [Candidatus Fibromonas sp.]